MEHTECSSPPSAPGAHVPSLHFGLGWDHNGLAPQGCLSCPGLSRSVLGPSWLATGQPCSGGPGRWVLRAPFCRCRNGGSERERILPKVTEPRRSDSHLRGCLPPKLLTSDLAPSQEAARSHGRLKVAGGCRGTRGRDAEAQKPPSVPSRALAPSRSLSLLPPSPLPLLPLLHPETASGNDLIRSRISHLGQR